MAPAHGSIGNGDLVVQAEEEKKSMELAHSLERNRQRSHPDLGDEQDPPSYSAESDSRVAEEEPALAANGGHEGGSSDVNPLARNGTRAPLHGQSTSPHSAEAPLSEVVDDHPS